MTIVSNVKVTSTLGVRRPGFWALSVFSDTSLSFTEAGSLLSLSKGSVWISRSGGLVSVNWGSVMAGFSGTVNVSLHYPHDSRAYMNLGHGEVAVTMAGVQDSLFSLTISGDSTAVVASRGRMITVTPIRGGTVTITQRATAAGDFYALSYEETGGVQGGGLTFSVIAPATGWTVSDSGVVGPNSAVGLMEAVVVEVSDPYSKTQSWMIGHPTLSLTSPVKSEFPLLTSVAGDMPLLTLADLEAAVGGGLPPYQLGTPTTEDEIALSGGVLRLSSPGVLGERRAATIRVTDGTAYNMLDFVLNVRFVPPFGFRNAATVLAVAEDYSGVVQTLTAAAIGVTATVTYSTATPDVAVGGSDGVLSLATPLAGNDKGVTVTATDGRSTVTHVLTLRSVSPLVLSLPPTLYVPASEDFWTSPTPLTVTGGDGGGATVFQTFSESSGLYKIDAEGIVNVVSFELKKVGISEAAFTVSVSQPAVIGGRTTADILNIFVYDSLSVAYLPTLTVEIGRTGAIAGGVVMPAGGSGDYGFSVVSGGATVGTDGALGLSTAVTMTTTLSVVVAVTDQVLTALAVSVTAVLESRFVDRVRPLAAFETRHYVLEAGEGRPFSSSPLVALTVTGKGPSDGGYEWGEAAGTDAQGLLSVRSTTGVATVQVTARAGSIVTVAYTITVGRDEAVGVTTALTVVFYQGRLAFLRANLAVSVFTGVAGVVHTVMTEAGTGSGDVSYSLVSPAYSTGNGDRPITLTLLAGGVVSLQTPLVSADSADIEVTVVAVDNNLDVTVRQVLALAAVAPVPDVEVTASGTGNGVLSGGVAATVTAGGDAFGFVSSQVVTAITAVTETGGRLRFVESRWTVTVQGDSTVVFRENLRQLVLLGGEAGVDRRGGITSFSSPSVTVNLLGTRVGMRYVDGGTTYVRVEEGTVSINVAGATAWQNYLSVSFGGTSEDLKAVIVPDGGTPQTVVPPPVQVTVTATGGSGVLYGLAGPMTVMVGGEAVRYAASLAVTATVAESSVLRFVHPSWNFDVTPGRVLFPGTGSGRPGVVAVGNRSREIYSEHAKLSVAVRSGVNLVRSRFVTVRFDEVDMEMRWPFSASSQGNPLIGDDRSVVAGIDAAYTGDNAYVGLRRGTVMVHVAGPLETYLDHFYLLSRDGVRAVLVPQGGTPVTVVPLLPAGAVTVTALSGASGVLLTLATALSEDLVGGVAGSHDYDIQSLPAGWVETDEVVSVSSSTLTTAVNPPPPLRQTRKVISVSSPAGITEATRIDVEVSDRYNTGSETWAIHFEVEENPLTVEVTVTATGGSGVLYGGATGAVMAGGAAVRYASSLAVTATVAESSTLRFAHPSWNFDVTPGRVLFPGTGSGRPGVVAVGNRSREIYSEHAKLSVAVRSGVNLVRSRFVTVRFDEVVDMEMRWPFSASQLGSPLAGLGWPFVTGIDAGYTGDSAYVGLRRGTVTVHVAGPLETYLDRFYLLSRDGVRAVLMPQGGTPVTVVPLLPAGTVTVRAPSGASGALLTLATALPEGLVGGVAGSHDYDIQSLPAGWVETDEVVSVSSSTLTTAVNPPPPLRQTRKVISITSPAQFTAATRINVEVSDDYNTGSETWVIHFEVAATVGYSEDLYYVRGGEAAVALLSLDIDGGGGGSPDIALSGHDYGLVAEVPDEGGSEGDGRGWFVAMAGFSPAGERARFRRGHLVYDAGFMGWNEREL